MKLWLRQTLVCAVAVLLSVSACLYGSVALQTRELLNDARQTAAQNVAVLAEQLLLLERTGVLAEGKSESERRNIVQDAFFSYALVLQDEGRQYALLPRENEATVTILPAQSLTDGGALPAAVYTTPTPVPVAAPEAASDTLIRISTIDAFSWTDGDVADGVFARLLPDFPPLPEGTLSDSRMVAPEGAPSLLVRQNLTVFSQPYTLYGLESLEDTLARIQTLARSAQLTLLACLTLCLLLLPLLLRATLRPLRRLTRVSEQIANGRYSLRARLRSRDEVGELSASFDHMAETVEQKIRDLEETARRRELLLGALTHEMKTPMTAIIGFSDSLMTMPLDEEGRLEAAHEIHEAAQRTERLSQKMMQLIAMTDCPVLVKQPLDTRAFWDAVQSAVAPQLSERGVTVHAELQTETLLGDGDLLHCLLVNLIDNAAKASRAGGEIAVQLAPGRITVADHGCGIPADAVSLVTEPFYRVDKARSRRLGGAGLGLSLCQIIAQAHGGTLQINSIVGLGTSISMQWEEKACTDKA